MVSPTGSLRERAFSFPRTHHERLRTLLFTATVLVILVAWEQSCNLQQYPLGQGNDNLPVITKGNRRHDEESSNNDTVDDRSATSSIDFIRIQDLNNFDVFAAAWWQSIPRFLQVNITMIESVEEDAFVPILYTAGGKKDARMTVDWLDFSLEHLSKWWKVMGVRGEVYATGKLQSYVQRAMDSEKNSNVMASTLAVIPYGVESRKKTTQQIWLNSLAATISSLLRQGVGRVVVVGYYNADYTLTLDAFRLLLRYQNGPQDMELRGGNEAFSVTLGSTELAYVKATYVESELEWVHVNVPKGALKGLQEALNGERPDAEDWIGRTPENFKYIYMTEADQILHARLSSYYHETMDRGGIIIPHRLQPIPHALDVQVLKSKTEAMLPVDEFPQQNVHELGRFDSCCDTSDRAGVADYPDCGHFWWLCGFYIRGEDHSTRLSSYEFMRLTGGTGIVNLASNEIGRKCKPTKKARGGCRGVRKTAKTGWAKLSQGR